MQNNKAGMGRLIVPVLLGAAVGPVLQLQQPALWPAGAYAWAMGLALALGALAGIWQNAGRRRGLLVLALAATAAFGLAGWRATQFQAQALLPHLEGQDVSVTGVVAAMPQRNELGERFRFDVEAAQAGGKDVPLPPHLALGWYGGTSFGAGGIVELQREVPQLRAGQRWRLTVRLRAPHGNLNPHGFDYELWLWEQGLQATGYVRAGPADPAPERIASTWQHPVEQARQAVRDAIFQRVADRKSAGLIAALVVGDQRVIDRADWDVFRATGVAHLMSISGLHVTMFAWAAAGAIGLLWRRSSRLCLAWPAPHAAMLGGLLLAAAYALFSGWGVPAQRTLWMLGAVGALRLAGRRWPWPAVWLLAWALVATMDPWAVMQAGFWLSFVAVGVLFATDRSAPPSSPRRREPRAAGETWIPASAGMTTSTGSVRTTLSAASAAMKSVLREQGVVTLALAPLSLLLFGQVSLVGLAANLLAIPWVTLLVTPLAMAGVLLPPLWDAAAWAVQGMGWVLQWMAGLPWATFSSAAPPLWAGAAGVAGGLLLAMRLPLAVRALGLPLMLPVMLWQVARPASGEFELLAADVGQGNAVIVRTAGHTLVYDSGPRYSAESDAGHRVLVPLLRALGERVDTLVLSHRDIDHTGGAPAVLAMQPQAALVGSLEEGHPLRALRPLLPCLAGQRWRWDGVDFEFLHPAPGDAEGRPRPNALSCVLRIANGRQAALLVGDIEQPQEARLVAQAAPLKADVLLVPHHGSKTSSSAAFLDAVQPALALVQAGYRNRFGHPAEPVLERYRVRGIAIIDSAHCGAAWWSSARPEALQCERQAAARYWHHRLP